VNLLIISKTRLLILTLCIFQGAALTNCGTTQVKNSDFTKDTLCPPFLFDFNTLTKTSKNFDEKKEPFYTYGNHLIVRADKWMDTAYYSVTNKKHLPVSGNKHDYYSIGVYWWPDTSKPDGKPYIRRDGYRNPERFEYDSPSLANMIEAVGDLTLAFSLTKKTAYKNKAIGFLKTWFLNEDTRMIPNLEYGQAIPGISDGRGIGIIETYKLVHVVDAIGVLYRCGALSDDIYIQLRNWFKDYNHWLKTSKNGNDERNWHNNHGSSYDFQSLSFSLFVGDTINAKSILDSVTTKRINKHIEPDGTQPFELNRTRAFHYPIYNLYFLCSIAKLGEQLNYDLWNYESEDHRSLSIAIQFLLPYVLEGKEWPYQRLDSMGKLKSDFFMVLNLAYNKIYNLDLSAYFKYYEMMDKDLEQELFLCPNPFLINKQTE
jgi:hypothetical protein